MGDLASPIQEITKHAKSDTVSDVEAKTASRPVNLNPDPRFIPMKICDGSPNEGKIDSSELSTGIQCSSRPAEHPSLYRSSSPTTNSPARTSNGALMYSEIKFSSSTFDNCTVNIFGNSQKSTSSLCDPATPNPYPNTKHHQTPNEVAKFSIRFGSLMDEIETTMLKEQSPNRCIHIACSLTTPVAEESIFPQAHEANDLKAFFRLGYKYKWWHWMDFSRLIQFLQACECPNSLDLLQRYQDDLSSHVLERLQQTSPPSSRGHWLQLKCECDSMKVTLETIKKHKSFLVEFLKIPEVAFTFDGHYDGCMVTVWKVHSEVTAKRIREFLESQEGAVTANEVERITSITVPVDTNSLCSDDVPCQKPMEHSCMVGGLVNTLPPSVVVGTCSSNLEKVESGMVIADSELELMISHDSGTIRGELEDIEYYSRLTEKGKLDVGDLSPQYLSAINSEGNSLLMIAVKHNQLETVEALLKTGLSEGVRDMQNREKKQSVVAMAAYRNNCNCLEVLLRYDCHPALPDIIGKLPLHYACANQCLRCVRMITGQARGLTGLSWAKSLFQGNCKDDSLEAVIDEAIARRQKEVVLPALFRSAVNGDVDHISQVLEGGDSVNITNDSGESPLLCAAKYGNLAVMEAVKKLGANMEHTDVHGNTLLHAATSSGNTSVVQFSLSTMLPHSLFHLNERNNYGETPLELAILKGDVSVVRLLVESGANSCIPDSSGNLLSSAEHEEIQSILEKMRDMHLEKLIKAINSRNNSLFHLRDNTTLREFLMSWQDPFDHNLRTRDGDSVLMVAVKSGRQKIVKFLCNSLQKCPRDSLICTGPDEKQKRLSLEKEQDTAKLTSPHVLSIDNPKDPPRNSLLAYCGMVEESPTVAGLTVDTAVKEDPVMQVCINHVTGGTVLHRAVESKIQQILSEVLNTFPQLINIQNSHGDTPIHLAASARNKGMIRILLNHSASVCLKNVSGDFPDQIFPKKKSKSLYKELLSRRAESTTDWSDHKESHTSSSPMASGWCGSSDYLHRERRCNTVIHFVEEEDWRDHQRQRHTDHTFV